MNDSNNFKFSGTRTKMNGYHGKYMVVLYTRPEDCGGKCRYCIKGNSVTSSTIPNEDTILAQQTLWSPQEQLKKRCFQEGLLLDTGNKFEMRIKGNSFTNYPEDYIENYIKSIYDFLNKEESSSIEEAFIKQQNAKDKCVQIVIETRPDQITPEWCELMLKWGIRTVEIGVQSLNDDVLEKNWRGHSTTEVRTATKLIREYGFELGYQVMVGLYGSSRQEDFDMLTHKIWQNYYYPDSLKIYPCLLLPDKQAQLPLYELYETGKWSPITNEEYDSFLNDVLPFFPYDVHVNRLQRIFTEDEVAFGPKKIINRQKYKNISNCMWQRSIQNSGVAIEKRELSTKLRLESYLHDNELCVQAVIDNVILGYARLSLSSNYNIIRDLRVLGNPLKVNQPNHDSDSFQHIGIGKSLIDYMEDYSYKQGQKKVVVHSSAGCVGYFRKMGYVPENYYTLYKML